MPFLSFLAQSWLIGRLFGGSRRHHRGYGGGSGRYPAGYGRRYPTAYGRRSGRSSGGFGMWGPFPTYSRRTRGGTRVSVGGCCLPIPLALALGTTVAARLIRRR